MLFIHEFIKFIMQETNLYTVQIFKSTARSLSSRISH